MAQITTNPTTSTPATALGPKQQFADVYAQEHATTLKVLRAFHQERASYQAARTIELRAPARLDVRDGEQPCAGGAARTDQDRRPDAPPPPPTFADVLSAYQASAKELMATLERTSDSRLDETVRFFTGLGQMGDVPVRELLWFTLMD